MQGRRSNKAPEPEAPRLFAWLGSAVTIALIVVTQLLPRELLTRGLLTRGLLTRGSLPPGDSPYLRGAGVFVLLLAGTFILAPFYLLSKHERTEDGRTYLQASQVVNWGLYAIVRHPQYLGYIFLACGFALLSPHWIAGLFAIVGATLFYLQAVREENYCLAQFGEPYELYLRQVPRFNVILGLMRLLRGS